MNIIWTQSQWLIPGIILLILIAVTLFISYKGRQSMPLPYRWLAGSLKLLGCILLFIFILEPKKTETFHPPGINHWVILADNSASMTIVDQKDDLSRSDRVSQLLTAEPQPWEANLKKDFIVRSYEYGSQLRRLIRDTTSSNENKHSNLGQALNLVKERYKNQPLSGILVLTDGTTTDTLDNLSQLPPVFPLVITPEKKLSDLAINSVHIQETLFEDAPLIVDISTSAIELPNASYTLSIHEIGGKKIGSETRLIQEKHETNSHRIQVKPSKTGTLFLEARIELSSSEEQEEATQENNKFLAAANRESGPYRVLYFGGRPNFEHKFLKRALQEDPSIQFTSLLRIAKREPKFEYKSRIGEKTNPLFRGFGDQEEAERFDQAVYMRLNTQYPGELAGGFPSTPEELFPFETVIIDDVEASFFTPSQMRLLQSYVADRGGSLIMLGGMESLDSGGYNNTPIGDLLPVYLDPETPKGAPLAGRFSLSREGFLEPWARLRKSSDAEKYRISEMPTFSNVHTLGNIRPGAMTIAHLETDTGKHPALAVRRYGRGRTAVLAITNLWRWGFESPESREDLNTTWRQLTRWLLADVPRPLSIAVNQKENQPNTKQLSAQLLGNDFQPKDSGAIKLRIKQSNKEWSTLTTTPSHDTAGVQTSDYKNAETGTYLAEASVRGFNSAGSKDYQQALTAEIGWTVNSLHKEFKSITPDLSSMQALAENTGGQILTIDDLEDFTKNLDTIPLPFEETRTEPLTKNAFWILIALTCFIGEWALRRWKKLL